MSMPHLNFLDIWGSSFKSFKKVSNLKLNLKSKIEDSSKTFSKLLKLLPRCSRDLGAAWTFRGALPLVWLKEVMYP